ncbi:MAG TPA: response regulator transcription factor [Luteibacter sp.]|uniref:response regulator transcription factor n=1 Tax=Luteibacter sp. TaxID=1886636 RepID=UPI002C1A654B|nr:response regulator transcription factor [Luteibacter sp.]HVI56242.1 response regulator transcription factor [Luteibacter sp.]
MSATNLHLEQVGPARPLRLALLDDDAMLRDRILAPKLRQFGFEVTATGSAAELHAVIRKGVPDIFLLDIGLPDGDGFQVARSLRNTLPHAGIIMLSGRADNVDRVRGLFEGADAYLTKPVEIDVLVATLYSVARRLEPGSTTAPHGHWALSPDEWFLLSPSGARVMLSKSERRLLNTMLTHVNEVVPREALISVLTDDVDAFDPHRLDSMVHRLRRKVLAALGEPLPLNAAHGTGYVLEG